MIFILYFLITFVGIYLVYTNILHKRIRELGNKFPGPKTLPIFGNSLAMINRQPDEILHFIEMSNKRYGKVFRVWFGSKLTVMITDPKVLELVLNSSTKNLPKNSLYRFLIPWLGDGLLLSHGQKWHNRRKIITPAFHFKILENFIDIFDKHSFALINKLREISTDDVINIYPLITLYALDVICETSMGTEINAQSDSDSEYVQAVHDIADVIAIRFSQSWQRSDFLFKFVAFRQKFKQDKAIKILHDFTENIIKIRRANLIAEMAKGNVNENHDYESNKKMALLDVLLKSTINGQPLSNLDIREEVDTFMFEGHDTTTSGICFTLWLISRHKDVQDKLINEIREVIGTDPNKRINYREIQDLKYMELVIKESLRLYPSVPLIGRELDADVVIDDTRIIPAGANFSMSLMTMFKDPELFPEPEKFIPERFTSANDVMDNISPFAYIPFSAGSRNCIGQKFAMLEMKSAISKILRHFELLPNGKRPRPYPELVLRSKNGIQLGLNPRNYKV